MTGEKGTLEDGEEGRERVLKDKMIKQGVELVKWVERGIINRVREENKEEKVTFMVEKEETVIDYMIENKGKHGKG